MLATPCQKSPITNQSHVSPIPRYPVPHRFEARCCTPPAGGAAPHPRNESSAQGSLALVPYSDVSKDMSHAAAMVALWATAQLAETGREGDGWCTYATCTETGATVSWAHGQGAFIRGCPGTPDVRRFLVRLRTTEQTDPGHTEQLFIDVEDKER